MRAALCSGAAPHNSSIVNCASHWVVLRLGARLCVSVTDVQPLGLPHNLNTPLATSSPSIYYRSH